MSDWIYEENLRPFLEATSWLAGYAFEDLDWDAVTVGLEQANAGEDDEEWFEYSLGDATVRLRSVYLVRVEVEGDPALERGVELAVALMQRYRCEKIET